MNAAVYINELLGKLLKTRGVYLFHTKMLQRYVEKEERLKLYYEALEKSDNQLTDNIYKQLRFNSLLQLVEHVVKKGLDGEYAECGCWKGHSAYLICKTLARDGYSKIFHIFDSFEGLSEKLPVDKNILVEQTPDEIKAERLRYAATEERVRKTLSDFNFVKLYKGWIPERFDEVKDLSFAFVHLDVDLYQPVLDSLKFFFPRLLKGGVIVFDDYGYSDFPGFKKAIDEFLSYNDCELFYEVPIGGCFLIK